MYGILQPMNTDQIHASPKATQEMWYTQGMGYTQEMCYHSLEGDLV